MAKPIPVNRRYLQNHQEATPTPPTATAMPAPPANHHYPLRELIAFLRGNPQHNDPDWEDDLSDDADALFDDPDCNDEANYCLHEALASWDDTDELLDPYDEDDTLDFDPEELVRAYMAPREDAPVIWARRSGACPVCGNPIQVGDRITRHAQMDAWVHVGCRSSQPRVALRSITARYSGYCRLCRQVFPPGQAITNLRGYGWVHLECAQRHHTQD
ncbi:MAG: hypothetical protein KatS3mg019_1943 [Fimbriimonadales bacterium]|nr:MAG: hypothetical protein KatS3mg019_1943 [Fimbriimonadales bacterium]